MEERFQVLTFQDPHFRSVETDANALVNAFFRHVSNEMHDMLGPNHDCTITMSGTDMVSLHQQAGGIDPRSNPGYASSSIPLRSGVSTTANGLRKSGMSGGR